MPKDWGEKWKIDYIPNLDSLIMNKALLAVIPIVIVGIIAAFAVSPYFTESTIDEALPTGAIIQPALDKEDTSLMMEEEEKMKMMEEEEKMKMMEEEEKMKMMEEEEKMKMMEEEEKMKMMEEEEKMKMMEEEEKMKMMEEEEKMKMMEEEEKMKMMEEEEKMKMMEEEEKIIPMSYVGTFRGVGDGVHDAQGDTFTIPLKDGNDVLRLENFKATNGPDLYVYLSTDKGASDYIDLGKLKASNGNQNYDIPNDVDLDKYNKVLIWCKAFGVLFGSAELSSR